jgi:TolB protein
MRAAAGLALALGVAMLILVGPTPTAAGLAYPGQANRRGAILFVGGPGSLDREGRPAGSGVYAVDAGSGRLKELVSGDVVRARWSPDGRRLAFVRWGAVSPELYVVRPGGGRPRLLAQTAWFTWSPDSKKIAYSQDTGTDTAIFILRAAGGHPTLVTSRGGQFLSWSPDGRKLAFVRDNESLYVINAVGTKPRQLARGLKVIQGYVSWSPDGARLAFYPCCNKGFAIVDADGSHLRTLVGRGILLPSWSPDGRRIALSGELTTGSGADLKGTFLIRPDGTGFRRISFLGDNPFTAAWSPDSRKLAVDDRCCTPDVWVISATGASAHRLTQGWRYGYAGYDPQWQPRGLRTANLRGRYVSPANPTDSVVEGNLVRTRRPVERLAADGRQVVYAADYWCEAWDLQTASVVRFHVCGASARTFGPAFAGGRLVWSSFSSAMQGDNWLVSTATTDVPRAESVTFPDRGAVFRNLPATAFAGDGDLLVFSTWGPCPVFIYPDSPCVHEPKQNGMLWRVDGAKAVAIASSGGALTPLSVDAGRILVDHENGTLELMRSDGSSLQTFHVYTGDFRGATVQGRNVVVLKQASIADYDAGSGVLLHERPLPAGEQRLDDVQNGLAVYVSGTDVHLLRLADGRDAVIHAPGPGPVLAQLEPIGLFYSYSVDDPSYPGRIAFVPFDQLPLR